MDILFGFTFALILITLILFAVDAFDIKWHWYVLVLIVEFTGLIYIANIKHAQAATINYSGYSQYDIDIAKLPVELKQCKFYAVSTADSTTMRVAYCPGTSSTNTQVKVGKTTQDAIVITKD